MDPKRSVNRSMIQCWCAVDADLTMNGDELESDECDYLCAGTTTDEYCGGRNKLTAYVIEETQEPEYIGCYQDGVVRVMDAEGKHTTGDMTNEVNNIIFVSRSPFLFFVLCL